MESDYRSTVEHELALVRAERRLIVEDFHDPLVSIGRIRRELDELAFWRRREIDAATSQEHIDEMLNQHAIELTNALDELEHALTFAESLDAFVLLATARRGVELGLRVEQHRDRDDANATVAVEITGASLFIRYEPLHAGVEHELAAAIAVASSCRYELAGEKPLETVTAPTESPSHGRETP